MSPRQDLITSILLFVLTGALFLSLRDTPDRAAMVPRATLNVMWFLSSILLARSAARIGAERRSGIRGDEPAFFGEPRLFAVTVVAYAGLIGPLGFYTASALFLAVLIPLLGFRRPLVIGAITAGFLIGFWLVFEVVFGRVLPREFFEAILRAETIYV